MKRSATPCCRIGTGSHRPHAAPRFPAPFWRIANYRRHRRRRRLWNLDRPPLPRRRPLHPKNRQPPRSASTARHSLTPIKSPFDRRGQHHPGARPIRLSRPRRQPPLHLRRRSDSLLPAAQMTPAPIRAPKKKERPASPMAMPGVHTCGFAAQSAVQPSCAAQRNLTTVNH